MNGRSARWLLWRGILAITAVTLAGCRGCDDLPPPPGPGERRPGGIDSVPQPENERMQSRWLDASAAMITQAAPAPTTMLRYQVQPGCRLGYQTRYLQLTEVAAGRAPSGSEVLANLQAEAADGSKQALRWSMLSSSTARIVDGKLQAPGPGATVVAARVRTDGNSWREVDGPHLMWTVFASQPPLGLTHPTLPPRPAVGTQRLWSQHYYSLATAKTLLARKNSRYGRKVSNPSPLSRPVEVGVGGWLSLPVVDAGVPQPELGPLSEDAGVRQPGGDAPEPELNAVAAGEPEMAAVVVAAWDEEDVTDSPLPHEKLSRYKARYVISSRGHVLHAIILGRTRHWWSSRPGESNQKESASEFELRLTSACGSAALRPARMGGRLAIDAP